MGDIKDVWESMTKTKDPMMKFIVIFILLAIAVFLIRTAYLMAFRSISEPINATPVKDTVQHNTSLPVANIHKDTNAHTRGIKKKTPNIEKIKKNDETQTPPIVNNGNLSMGQQGGVVNQNNYNVAELPDRKLNQEDIDYLKSIIPQGYKVDVEIVTSNSQETQDYGMQLLGYLQSNYNVVNSTLIGISSGNKHKGRKRFYLGLDKDQKLVKVFVQTQD